MQRQKYFKNSLNTFVFLSVFGLSPAYADFLGKLREPITQITLQDLHGITKTYAIDARAGSQATYTLAPLMEGFEFLITPTDEFWCFSGPALKIGTLAADLDIHMITWKNTGETFDSIYGASAPDRTVTVSESCAQQMDGSFQIKLSLAWWHPKQTDRF